jgi:5'-3' exonuclease
MFLDFNGIIHQCVNKLKNDESLSSISNEMIFEQVVIVINKIIKRCPPKNLLYIAIDGVAPFAKQQQQRKRRYLSAYTNALIEKCKKENNIKFISWDTNQITPGTEFMKQLNAFLKKIYSNDKNVIVSGSDEYGEGEHKAINYIKENQGDFKDVIFGLDGDLIMLALTCEKNDIYLMREDQDDKTENEFSFLNIDILRSSISKRLFDCENIIYTNDFVVLCFFIGNDFLPNIAILKLRYKALDILCDLYKKIHSKLGQNLVIRNDDGEYNLNYTFMVNLIEELSKGENAMMSNITNDYNNIKVNPNFKTKNAVDNVMESINNYPLVNKMSHLVNPSKNPNWRMDYYHHLFDGDHSASCIKSACTSYLEGLVWNLDYYFNRKFSYDWFYKYHYAPTLLDIFKYISIMSPTDLYNLHISIDQKKNIIDPELQLLMVLPPQSIEIIPKKYRFIMNSLQSGAVHYFPKQFKMSTFLKNIGWEVIPLLPIINHKHIYDLYQKTLTFDISTNN